MHGPRARWRLLRLCLFLYYNATGVRVRDYPVTLDKLLAKMPAMA